MLSFCQASEVGTVGEMLAKYGETPIGAINQVAPRALATKQISKFVSNTAIKVEVWQSTVGKP
jgi:hypothetical protein